MSLSTPYKIGLSSDEEHGYVEKAHMNDTLNKSNNESVVISYLVKAGILQVQNAELSPF